MTRVIHSGTILLVVFFACAALWSQKKDNRRQEEAKDYFTTWLEEDVTYIISEAEREIFLKLSNPEEKERFIEQFWQRRDSDPRTAANEFKEEHYRRIAYANEHFESGFAGWKTDRGRIYIIHGPPDSIDASASGGAYERPFHEGGGATATFPFEIWRYRYIEGIGDGVELEFVDKTWTGDFKLALSADEKDVFLRVEGHGNTLAENVGMATRTQRLNMTAATRALYPMMHHRIKDSPFHRYETFSRVKAPPQFKHPELRRLVDVTISFDELPFQARPDYFRIGHDRLLVPLTVEFQNQDLLFNEGNGVYEARIGIYGALTSINGQVVFEFDDDLVSRFPVDGFETGRTGRTLYQKLVFLERGGRYKLDLVAKDFNSGNIGIVRKGLASPISTDEGALTASSLILADYIEQFPTPPDDNQMFVLGDIKVRPTLTKAFPAGGVLGVYLQLYGAQLDQTTLLPSVRITYRISRNQETFLEIHDDTDALTNIYADGRIVLTKGLPLSGLPDGRYRAEVSVKDQISGEDLTLSESFQIVAAPSLKSH